MRALPGDFAGPAKDWAEVILWLRRLEAVHQTVHVHIGPPNPDRPYARLYGELHHVLTDPDGAEWFAVGDTAPEPGDLGGPWTYLRLPEARFTGAHIETHDDDDFFIIAIEFGDQSVLVGDECT